ncbi:MAG: acyl carrier protein [Eubacterium sp.]|nr:acyl carrier protein [Eubacterium sp.]
METIIEIIKGIKPSAQVDENTRLIDEKVLDSLAMISLVAELSDEFDVDISAQDIIPENFETVKAIKALMERLEDED